MKQKELSARHRAQLFAQLRQTERAGLSARNAADLLTESADPLFKQNLGCFRRQLATGESVAAAGSACGLFHAWEARLIEAAGQSGQLDESYTALSNRYTERDRRSRKLKSGLMLPLVLFVLAVLVAPLAALVTGEMPAEHYLALTSGRLGLFFGALYLLSWSWRRLGKTGADSSIFRMLLRVPFFGKIIRRQQQRDFLLSLSLLLEAGVAAFDALKIATRSISHPTLRANFARAEHQVRQGESISDALRICGVLSDDHAENLARAAEHSGRIGEMLRHLVTGMDEEIEQQYSILSEWSPRVAYLIIVMAFVFGR